MRVRVGLHVHVCTTGVSSVILTRLFFISSVAWSETLPDTPVDEMPPGPEVPEKIKKRYRKKKTKLEEAFPTYLQVCGRWHHKALAAIWAGMGLMAFSLFNCHRIPPASAVALEFSMIDIEYFKCNILKLRPACALLSGFVLPSLHKKLTPGGLGDARRSLESTVVHGAFLGEATVQIISPRRTLAPPPVHVRRVLKLADRLYQPVIFRHRHLHPLWTQHRPPLSVLLLIAALWGSYVEAEGPSTPH